MNDLDRLARHHAEVLHESAADAERPELMARRRPVRARTGLLVAAVAAVLAIAPLAWQGDQTTPADTDSTLVTTTTTATPTTGAASEPGGIPFDLQRFATAKLDGAFGTDESRVGMVVLVPGSDRIDSELTLTELESYVYVDPEVVAELAADYGARRRMEPLDGPWQAYGLIPEYWDTPVWEWEDELRLAGSTFVAVFYDFEGAALRIREGWSVVAELPYNVASGSVTVPTDAGLAIINSAGTTIVGHDGSTRSAEPPPVDIPELCCGDVVGYSYGGGILLLDQASSAWLFDVGTLAWREIDPLPSDVYPVGSEIYPLGSAVISGELYVVIRAPRTVNTVSQVAVLEQESGTWRLIESVPSPITIGGVTTDGERLIVAGTHQDYSNQVLGGRSPAVFAYTEDTGWGDLRSIPIDGQASTITWVDDAGLLAWNYDLESALLGENGTWQHLGDVPMDTMECLPFSVQAPGGAVGVCGGLAWFDAASFEWRPIEAHGNAYLFVTSTTAYAVPLGHETTPILAYPLPPE
jgi:hypothetical protein